VAAGAATLAEQQPAVRDGYRAWKAREDRCLELYFPDLPANVLAAARDAQKSYDPLISNLKDQWTYLGHDLNPSGIASLKPDADKLNQSATVLFKKIDDGMKTANDYITSLRSQKPATDD